MNKVYACSDLHGMYNLWSQIRDYCDENDTIYFLGDAADRGPDGIKIINELLRDKRVVYLKGNHEDMLCTCIPDFIEGHFHNMAWWHQNGGDSTYDRGLSLLDEDTQLYYAQRLSKLPETAWYKSPLGHTVFLSHAGTDLDLTEDDLRMMGRQYPYLWDRKHIGCGAPIGEHKGVFQVHGHTPVISDRFYGYNKNMKIETLFYDDHKYCIDMGAFATCKAALIDLDTFETKYFYDEMSMKESTYE